MGVCPLRLTVCMSNIETQSFWNTTRDTLTSSGYITIFKSSISVHAYFIYGFLFVFSGQVNFIYYRYTGIGPTHLYYANYQLSEKTTHLLRCLFYVDYCHSDIFIYCSICWLQLLMWHSGIFLLLRCLCQTI